jgi:dTDP-glucose 4,6-dehydratase
MILVTGGAGFIGANFVLDWIAKADEAVVNLDKLTYAGNLETLASLNGNPKHVFVQGDIGDSALVERLLAEHRPRAVLNFAAESHVDRSIHGAEDFVQTNVLGTFRLLEAVRALLGRLPGAQKDSFRFLHVSTDEVYGSLAPADPAFTEAEPLRAQQPLFGQQGRQRPPGARVAPHLRVAGDHHQLLQQLRALPLPGETDPADDRQRAGRQAAAGVRRRAAGARLAVRRRPLQRPPPGAGGRAGRGRPTTWAAGTRSPTSRSCTPSAPCWTNCVRRAKAVSYKEQITFVKDRPGHDRRYAIDARKIERELGWKPAETFETGIRKTVQWYLANEDWVKRVQSGAYRDWIAKQYEAA